MVVLYGGFVFENACKRNLWGSNPRALAVWYGALARGFRLADWQRLAWSLAESSQRLCKGGGCGAREWRRDKGWGDPNEGVCPQCPRTLQRYKPRI